MDGELHKAVEAATFNLAIGMVQRLNELRGGLDEYIPESISGHYLARPKDIIFVRLFKYSAGFAKSALDPSTSAFFDTQHCNKSRKVEWR
jgi:hypothetical protein